MSARRNRWMAVSLAAGLALWGPAWAAAAPEEQELAQAEKEMNQEAASDKHAESLARQYDVETETVDRMRAENQGWGEISTQLALAKQLSKNDPDTYPTTNDGLARIEQQRDEGKGYGVIAKENGFKLGPVVSEVKRSQGTLRAASRVERPDKPGKPEKMERPSRPERPSKPERSSRSSRPDRS